MLLINFTNFFLKNYQKRMQNTDWTKLATSPENLGNSNYIQVFKKLQYTITYKMNITIDREPLVSKYAWLQLFYTIESIQAYAILVFL